MKKNFIKTIFSSEEQNQPDTSSWVVPYGNLMTFLMIFFFLLYAYTYYGHEIDYERVVTRIQAELGKIDFKLKKEIEKKERETEFADKLQKYMQERGLAEGAQVNISAQKIRVVFGEKAVLFASGKADLDETAISVLDSVAEMLLTLPETNTIIIEGHTDNVPIHTKEFANNWELSIARAMSVLNYFVNVKKIPPERFTIAGYGEFKPVTLSTDIARANDTEEKRAKNRRIELVISRI